MGESRMKIIDRLRAEYRHLRWAIPAIKWILSKEPGIRIAYKSMSEKKITQIANYANFVCGGNIRVKHLEPDRSNVRI